MSKKRLKGLQWEQCSKLFRSKKLDKKIAAPENGHLW